MTRLLNYTAHKHNLLFDYRYHTSKKANTVYFRQLWFNSRMLPWLLELKADFVAVNSAGNSNFFLFLIFIIAHHSVNIIYNGKQKPRNIPYVAHGYLLLLSGKAGHKHRNECVKHFCCYKGGF